MNVISPNVLGFKRLRRSVSIKPALENSHSDGTEV